MRRVIQTLAVLAILGALAGAAVVGLGLYNVSARVGHLPGVSWMLHTTFRNAVRLRATRPQDMPDLADPALIELGARHYDAACRTCHAAPGAQRTATMTAMLPVPPHIDNAVHNWQPRHLHWIVANGVKMSGMPGWSVKRDDDVWPVVAFLMAVKDGMDADRYAALTQTPDAPAPRATCLGCHGNGGSEHVPRLDIQSATYLAMSLRAYRNETRASGIMAHAVSEVPEKALNELAKWFAAQPVEATPEQREPAPLVERGRNLAAADTGDPNVPACRACHGPDASEASELFPALAGLPTAYLSAQLKQWRTGQRGGGPKAELMYQAAQKLDDSDIAALAAYYANLPPTAQR